MGRGLQRLATVFQSPLIGQPDFTAGANSCLLQLFFVCLKFYPTGQNNSLELMFWILATGKNCEQLTPTRVPQNSPPYPPAPPPPPPPPHPRPQKTMFSLLNLVD